MTVRLYQSTDGSAPVLTGQVGKLTDLLDAVLVNGYGAKTAAGWTIAHTATNKRNYTMGSGGTGFSLFVDDAGPGAGAAKEARLTGFEVVSAIGVGTGQFPTTGQQAAPAGALVCRKSTTADATARAWTIIADAHTFYLFVDTGDKTSPVMAFAVGFGDFFSYSASDSYNCIIIARTIENSAEAGVGPVTVTGNLYEPFSQTNGFTGAGGFNLTYTIMGHFIARNFNGVGGSLACGKHSDIFKKGANSLLTGALGAMNLGRSGSWNTSNGDVPAAFPYPAPPNSGLFLSPVWLHHGGFVRGYLKGLWDPCHFLALGHWDTFAGTGNMSAKSFISLNTLGIFAGNSYSAGQANVCIEYSDTWS